MASPVGTGPVTLGRAPRVLGLVADDLTGAGDAAVAFAERGWRVLLQLDPRRLPTPADTAGAVPTVLALSTSTRALTDDAAAAATARAITALRAAGAERIYLKVDSTVRGSVAGQVTGALGAWDGDLGRAHAVICPAFPEHHRTVVDGHVLVHGVPLEQTPAAHDPVTPRTTSDLTVILPGAVRGDVSQIGRVPRLVLDAATDADLDRLAAGIATRGADTVVVGSGGLAAALARSWSAGAPRPAPLTAVGGARVLVAVSSLHPATLAQLRHLRQSAAAGPVEVLTTDTLRTTAPDAAAADLAARVAASFGAHHVGALVAVGGDGAAAILRRLAADRVTVDGAISAGCPTGTIAGGTADGLRLVTKSGGFGDPTTLTTLVARLRSGTGSDRVPHPIPHLGGSPDRTSP